MVGVGRKKNPCFRVAPAAIGTWNWSTVCGAKLKSLVKGSRRPREGIDSDAGRGSHITVLKVLPVFQDCRLSFSLSHTHILLETTIPIKQKQNTTVFVTGNLTFLVQSATIRTGKLSAHSWWTVLKARHWVSFLLFRWGSTKCRASLNKQPQKQNPHRPHFMSFV